MSSKWLTPWISYMNSEFRTLKSLQLPVSNDYFKTENSRTISLFNLVDNKFWKGSSIHEKNIKET